MEKKDTAKKAAPKWGTAEWIRTYRFSTMDRKRRARVRKAIGEREWEELLDGPHTCCLTMKLDKVIDAFGIKLGKKNMQTLERALVTVSAFEKAIYDEAVAFMLAKAWKVEM